MWGAVENFEVIFVGLVFEFSGGGLAEANHCVIEFIIWYVQGHSS